MAIGSAQGPDAAAREGAGGDRAQRKRLLIVSYFFPPVGGVGAQRPLRFARYLPEHGWDVTVVAPDRSDYQIVDDFATSKDGAYRVARARALDIPRKGSRPHRWVVDNVLFPDQRACWRLSATPIAWWLARECDAVMSTSSPITTHMIGMQVSRARGLPWIADFRDPYTTNKHTPRLRDDERHVRLERTILARCSAVTVVTPEMQEEFSARTDTPVHCVTNGFDPEEFAGLDPVRLPGTVTLLHAGSLYGDRSIFPFLEALEHAARLEPNVRDRLRVHFVGQVPPQQIQQVSESPVAGLVSFTPYVTRRQALSLMLGADRLLLLLPPTSAHAVPGKLYDYIASCRPILAMIPPGTASSITRRAGGTVVHDLEPLARALVEMGTEGPQAVGCCSESLLQDFSAGRLAGALAGILDTITDADRSR